MEHQFGQILACLKYDKLTDEIIKEFKLDKNLVRSVKDRFEFLNAGSYSIASFCHNNIAVY